MVLLLKLPFSIALLITLKYANEIRKLVYLPTAKYECIHNSFPHLPIKRVFYGLMYIYIPFSGLWKNLRSANAVENSKYRILCRPRTIEGGYSYVVVSLITTIHLGILNLINNTRSLPVQLWRVPVATVVKAHGDHPAVPGH